MHSQIYSGLSWIFAILLNFRVAGANGFISARWANIVYYNFIVPLIVLQKKKKTKFQLRNSTINIMVELF